MFSIDGQNLKKEGACVIMKLNVLRADPAGNITLFVLDPVEKSRRADGRA